MTPGSYVVVFASTRQGGDGDGYAEMAARMVELASVQSGFLGMRSVRGADGAGITVCYWDTAESIAAWKRNVDHAAAQEQGRQGWYAEYAVTIARVERHYGKGD